MDLLRVTISFSHRRKIWIKYLEGNGHFKGPSRWEVRIQSCLLPVRTWVEQCHSAGSVWYVLWEELLPYLSFRYLLRENLSFLLTLPAWCFIVIVSCESRYLYWMLVCSCRDKHQSCHTQWRGGRTGSRACLDTAIRAKILTHVLKWTTIFWSSIL
jgi:hypothetical protein